MEFGKAFEQMYLQWLDDTIAFVEKQRARGTDNE
ncbi:MAG: hypothetical protein H3C34_04090 [Caldilineaceae bacterium]|nr:hypothetical protein [Caldilineaceae bacterium]